MADGLRKYGGFGALGLLLLLVAGGVIYFYSRPQIPVAPPVLPPAPQAATVTPPVFDVVRVDSDGNAVLAGRAAPGAMVTVKSGDTVIGSATADAQGAFVILPASPLPAGAQELTLSETMPDGSVMAGTASADVDVPAQGKALAVLNGANGSTVLSGQGPQAGVLGLGTVDYDANGHAIFSGTAPAGATVEVSLGNAVVGHAVAGSDGRWKFTAKVPQTSGMLNLAATTAAGVVVPPVSAPFALETLPDALAAGHVVITPGDNLWIIARHVYGQGNLYTLIYTANANQIRDPNLIFPGQAFALPKPTP